MRKFNFKKSLIGLTLMGAMLTFGHQNPSADAAVAKINYLQTSGVAVKTKSLTQDNGQLLQNDTSWLVLGSVSRLNTLYYQLGANQFVPAKYLDQPNEYSSQKLNALGQINYQAGYSVIGWDRPDIYRKVIKNAYYLHGTTVNLIERKIINGDSWYKLANGQWLFGQNIKLVSESNRSEKTFAKTPDVPNTTQTVPAPQKQSASASINVQGVNQIIINLINQYRAQNGLNKMSVFGGLQTGSAIRANEEIAAIQQTGNNNSVDHKRPNGTSFTTEPNIRSFGVGHYGENLAVVNAQADDVALAQHFANLWIASPGHRANILDARFTATGVTVIKLANGQYIGMQEFAGR